MFGPVIGLQADAFFGGSGSSTEVPGRFDLAIDGYGFVLDSKYFDDFKDQSVALLQPQQDTDKFSERSLNREEFPRWAQDSWHQGAGQTFSDRPESLPYRFRTSKGIDPWTQNQLTLLNATASRKSASGTNLYLTVAGSRVYLTDGTALYYTTDVPTGSMSWTSVTGVSGTAATSMCSDGYYVYTSHGTDGVYITNTGSGASAKGVTGTVYLVRWVKGRLMAAGGKSVYNIIATNTSSPSSLPTALNAPPLADQYTWVDFAEGPNYIYAAGYIGDKSTIWKTTIKADGTALDSLTMAGELPDGEIVRSAQGYLGYLVIGTDKGVRFSTIDSNGNLVIGALIPTTSAVSCFEPQDRFVWYGLTNFDTTSSGLGRIDLLTFTDADKLTPAYASDLMATAQGAVQGVVTFGGYRLFTVSASGVYGESTVKVASGTMYPGRATFGIPDNKVAMFADMRFLALVGSVSMSIATDAGMASLAGTETVQDQKELVLSVGQSLGQFFELQPTLSRLNSSDTTGPTVTRLTLEANPAPGRGEFRTYPILLFETVTQDGIDIAVDVKGATDWLLARVRDGRPHNVQDIERADSAFLDDYVRIKHSPTKNKDAWNSTFILKCRVPRARNN